MRSFKAAATAAKALDALWAPGTERETETTGCPRYTAVKEAHPVSSNVILSGWQSNSSDMPYVATETSSPFVSSL